MLRVEFITAEDEGDLIVSFALAPSAHKSLTLLRSPQYEFLLPADERGISVSALNPKDQERDLLRLVRWHGNSVTVKTERHEYKLDISAVAEDELVEGGSSQDGQGRRGPCRSRLIASSERTCSSGLRPLPRAAHARRRPHTHATDSASSLV